MSPTIARGAPDQGSRPDHEIHDDIRAEFAGLPVIVDPCLVAVAVEDGVVRLTGIAASYAQKWAIAHAVGRVVGVREVRDHVDVRPPGGHRRMDERVERIARRALAWDVRVPGGIRVEVTDGVLRLRGAVARSSQREAAEDAVRNLAGIRGLQNEIRLALSVPAGSLESDVRAALHRRFGALAERIRVGAVGGVVTLHGEVATVVQLEEVESVAGSTPGASRVDNRVLVVT